MLRSFSWADCKMTLKPSSLSAMLGVLVCVASFGFCLGQVVKPGPCPEFIPKTDFSMYWYQGYWIEILRFPTEYEKGQTCNFAEYFDQKYGDGTISVHNGGLEADGTTFTDIHGYAELTNVTGSLDLYLDGVPFVDSYNVLATDYNNYSSVYSCKPVLESFHIEQAWVLARSHGLTDSQTATALTAFTRWGIDITTFEYTPRDDCSALP